MAELVGSEIDSLEVVSESDSFEVIASQIEALDEEASCLIVFSNYCLDALRREVKGIPVGGSIPDDLVKKAESGELGLGPFAMSNETGLTLKEAGQRLGRIAEEKKILAMHPVIESHSVSRICAGKPVPSTDLGWIYNASGKIRSALNAFSPGYRDDLLRILNGGKMPATLLKAS